MGGMKNPSAGLPLSKHVYSGGSYDQKAFAKSNTGSYYSLSHIIYGNRSPVVSMV